MVTKVQRNIPLVSIYLVLHCLTPCSVEFVCKLLIPTPGSWNFGTKVVTLRHGESASNYAGRSPTP